MVCFAYDPLSCNIAARYRDRFSDHWTPEPTFVEQTSNPATFKGITIITKSEQNRPLGAIKLRDAFLNVPIDAHLGVLDPSSPLKLEPNEFAVWIGGKP
jgi:hypothetical protein